MKRELSSYFNSPIAYIVTALFLILTGSFFMSVFYLNRNASLRNLFTLFPMILPAFVPALTMRLYAEEKKSGSLETLLTLPVSDFQVAMGKFLFAFIASAIMIAPTLIYLVGIVPFGKPDIGPVIGGYAASLLLCALFSSIGLFASSITRNQIVSFFVGAGICYVLSLIDWASVDSIFISYIDSFLLLPIILRETAFSGKVYTTHMIYEVFLWIIIRYYK